MVDCWRTCRWLYLLTCSPNSFLTLTVFEGSLVMKALATVAPRIRFSRAMILEHMPFCLIAMGAILLAGVAVSIAAPTCWVDQDPIPTTCDREMPPGTTKCPNIPITDPPCGTVSEETNGFTEFTTYDQRTCIYQPRKRDAYGSECINDGGQVETAPMSCQATQGTTCTSGGGIS